MVIDKNMNLDQELEYFKDGGLAFAQNIVVSPDGLTIQNEPAIVNFLSMTNIDIVGFIACNEEFVLFGKENEGTESVIYRISKNCGDVIKCDTNWHHQGGEVFGTFTYNVANELIVAISERNFKNDCPLKIINLDRDTKIENITDDIYTLTPNIPKANMTNIGYVLGNRIKKGKYNFFIKYYIDDTFETSWFPIGSPVFVYDNLSANEIKTIDSEKIQAIGELDDKGIPKSHYNYNILYEDFYNEDIEYTNNNVKLSFEIKDIINYTHYRIGYIVNTNTGIEGKQTAKYALNKEKIDYKVVIKDYSEAVSVDDLTISAFNLYNVNTMCNYKDRLYLANYKEENRNKTVSKIDTSQIRVLYKENNISTFDGRVIDEDITDDSAPDEFEGGGSNSGGAGGSVIVDESSPSNFNARKREWVSKPGRCAIYNFFIHYVYPNGNYTDGIHIGNVISAQEAKPSGYEDYDFLETITNSKNDVLYKTPQTSSFNVDKLIFTGIKMYPEFIGFFISYENPEYIQIGEGFCIPMGANNYDTNEVDFFTVKSSQMNSHWKFYYPEFNIVGGKTSITNVISTGIHEVADNKVDFGNLVAPRKGFILPSNNFIGEHFNWKVKSTSIISPSSYENIGKEGYLRLDFDSALGLGFDSTGENKLFKSYTAIHDTTDLYLSDNKKLVSLGYTKFVDYKDDTTVYVYGEEVVPYNYDFYRCFSSVIFFKSCGIIINQTESNHINAQTGEEYYYPAQPALDIPSYPHIGIVKYWHETHYPLFLKEINQAPETIFYSHYKQIYKDNKYVIKNSEQYQQKALVLNPQYINDLYKLDPIYYDYTGKLLVNYDKTLVSNTLEKYNKTIRRSDVIQSESVKTSWRFFRPENYKIITEDKGAINNIVGIGNYLFAHCEHSLFLFDITDSLQALDKNIQLLQPDSFEVAYKEVFTADKGYGGLQDYESWICDEFGYIFFDKSAKKIYRFDGGQLKDMTDGIDNFIKTIKPEHIWFGNDRERNRIMINIQSPDDKVILSYNLLVNGWSSTHSYTSNRKFIGLKDKLFIFNVEGNNLNISNYIDNEFNDFSLPVGNIDNDGSFKSFIDVVFTSPNYNKIKVLDFITYILDKNILSCFELLNIEIYTNCCYSGILDISEERKRVSDYKKPYYDYERWNFNYFRNIVEYIENPPIVDRITGHINSFNCKIDKKLDNALMVGKYIVIRFNFKNTSKQVNIKDIQAYFKP